MCPDCWLHNLALRTPLPVLRRHLLRRASVPALRPCHIWSGLLWSVIIRGKYISTWLYLLLSIATLGNQHGIKLAHTFQKLVFLIWFIFEISKRLRAEATAAHQRNGTGTHEELGTGVQGVMEEEVLIHNTARKRWEPNQSYSWPGWCCRLHAWTMRSLFIIFFKHVCDEKIIPLTSSILPIRLTSNLLGLRKTYWQIKQLFRLFLAHPQPSSRVSIVLPPCPQHHNSQIHLSQLLARLHTKQSSHQLLNRPVIQPLLSPTHRYYYIPYQMHWLI